MTILSISCKFNTSLVDMKWSNQNMNYNKLVTTMTKQNTLNQNELKSLIEEVSAMVGPDYDTIYDLAVQKLNWDGVSEDERNMSIFESFLSVWNLSGDEFDVLVTNPSAMNRHCSFTNVSLFERFEQNVLSRTEFSKVEEVPNTYFILFDVEGVQEYFCFDRLIDGQLFYGGVLFERYGAYTGPIKVTRKEFVALQTVRDFYPGVYC